jgi:hypothetical protein
VHELETSSFLRGWESIVPVTVVVGPGELREVIEITLYRWAVGVGVIAEGRWSE